MTPKQYQTIIDEWGMTQYQAAEWLGVSGRTSHAYANDRPIHPAVEKLMLLTLAMGLTPKEVDQKIREMKRFKWSGR